MVGDEGGRGTRDGPKRTMRDRGRAFDPSKPVRPPARCCYVECPICQGERWVCESHPLTRWDACCGDCGVPCQCNPAGTMPPAFTACECAGPSDSMDFRSAT